MKLCLLKKLAGDVFELQIEPSITGQRSRVDFQAHPVLAAFVVISRQMQNLLTLAF